MKYGVISCCYLARIYGYQPPQPFDWGAMQRKHLAEFTQDDLITLARSIHALGVENLELWWGHSDYHGREESDGMELAERLAAEGIYVPAYTIGSWSSRDLDDMQAAYRYARGLGARVIVGALDAENPGPALERMALLADLANQPRMTPPPAEIGHGPICHNPNCITQTEHYLPPLVKKNGGVDCCAFCDAQLR